MNAIRPISKEVMPDLDMGASVSDSASATAKPLKNSNLKIVV